MEAVISLITAGANVTDVSRVRHLVNVIYSDTYEEEHVGAACSSPLERLSSFRGFSLLRATILKCGIILFMIMSE